MKAATASVDSKQGMLDAALGLMSQRGFTAVGLNEILQTAGVPKGSFYHYFESKESFGQALLERYFDEYLDEMENVLAAGAGKAGDRLMRYWQNWADTQHADSPCSKCLVVKLAAEVADLSEAMRQTLMRGTDGIVARLAQAIEEGVADGSLRHDLAPRALAQTLYQQWLGASLLEKINRDKAPLKTALSTTERVLLGTG